MSRIAILQIHKEELKFSSGHCMIISADSRETMHGHDYQVEATFKTQVLDYGMAFDCRIYKDKLLALCASLDYRFILPGNSIHIQLEESADQWHMHFASQTISFYKQDTVVLPIVNATIEELSFWFLNQLTTDHAELAELGIRGMSIKVFNGRGESGASCWGDM